MKEVTLVFPPTFRMDENKKKELVSDLKESAYNHWLLYMKKKYCESSELCKVFPSRTNSISLGILSLSSYLKNRGIKVKYVHCDYLLLKKRFSWNSVLNFIAAESKTSDVCGIYSTTPMIDYAIYIAKIIKEKSQKIILVLGGPHVTFDDVEIINEYPYVDFVVRGEGEETLYQIVLKSENYWKNDVDILGATYRSNGIIKKNPDRPLLLAQDIPPPDFNILPGDFNLLLIDMYSRGCPFSCNFCVESEIWKKKVRYRDPHVVVDEFDLIKRKFHQDLIHIADSEIDISPEKLNSLLNAIDEKGLDIKFTVNLRPDAYKRLDITTLEKMNSLGFIGYFLGVESGSDDMLKRMGRKSTYSDFLKTIELLNQTDAKVVIPYLMLGFPGETEKTLQETQDKFIELLENEKISFLFPKIFIPYPGTAPFKNPELFSIKISKNWDLYSRFGFPPPFSSPFLSNSTLSSSIIRFYERIFDVFKRKVNK